jgi:hypothetical protein
MLDCPRVKWTIGQNSDRLARRGFELHAGRTPCFLQGRQATLFIVFYFPKPDWIRDANLSDTRIMAVGSRASLRVTFAKSTKHCY